MYHTTIAGLHQGAALAVKVLVVDGTDQGSAELTVCPRLKDASVVSTIFVRSALLSAAYMAHIEAVWEEAGPGACYREAAALGPPVAVAPPARCYSSGHGRSAPPSQSCRAGVEGPGKSTRHNKKGRQAVRKTGGWGGASGAETAHRLKLQGTSIHAHALCLSTSCAHGKPWKRVHPRP